MSRKDMRLDRRTFLQLAASSIATTSACTGLTHKEAEGNARSAAKGVLRLETGRDRAVIPFLSWDTEGGDRLRENLLRSNTPMMLRVQTAGEWRTSLDLATQKDETAGSGALYHLSVGPDAELLWGVHPAVDRLTLTLSGRGDGLSRVEKIEMVFPFNPHVTPTTVLPSEWEDDGSLRLPLVITAPDFGQMLLAEKASSSLWARLEGSRTDQIVDLVLEFPPMGAERTFTLDLTPVYLPPPRGLNDTMLWQAARRGWFNAFQPSAKWGDQDRPYSAPAGILANNVISDPVSCSLWFHADQALWTPDVAPGISVARLVRRTIDWWLDKRTRSTGEVVGYWDYGNFLDANAGPLIAAWDYVEATGDREWLSRRIERLEFIADFLAQRDVDGDGMVEATQSGNYGTLLQPARSCAWWDALNCGHKDGYSNAVIYRAWRCLAELEGQLQRKEYQERYSSLADRLKSVYTKTLYNPATGWLAWWKSADGQLHDYATPIVNGLAIDYGLVEPDEGRKILARLWQKMQAAGFTRLDLGLPCTLIPVRKGDYLQPDAMGMPSREDGTDTFQLYMNGGISAGHTLHFIMAHHIVGEPGIGDVILRAMLGRQARGEFQNGVQDKPWAGIDWTTWDGKPCGYEGYLADSFRFLQAVLLREPSFRARHYRPLAPPGGVTAQALAHRRRKRSPLSSGK